jgi:glycosyltransferase involved in cell wall biosynthesis
MFPTITVVVPVYNKAEYLTGALESLINQSEAPDQIVIIDDFSNDGSYEISKKYEDLNNNLIQVYKNLKNSGVSFSRNEGISRATSDYIMFLDADDEYHNTCIENLKYIIAQNTNENIFITKCKYRLTRFVYPVIPKGPVVPCIPVVP